jgi:hypothetical protein
MFLNGVSVPLPPPQQQQQPSADVLMLPTTLLIALKARERGQSWRRPLRKLWACRFDV